MRTRALLRYHSTVWIVRRLRDFSVVLGQSGLVAYVDREEESTSIRCHVSIIGVLDSNFFGDLPARFPPPRSTIVPSEGCIDQASTGEFSDVTKLRVNLRCREAGATAQGNKCDTQRSRGSEAGSGSFTRGFEM